MTIVTADICISAWLLEQITTNLYAGQLVGNYCPAVFPEVEKVRHKP
jgi:hypothetical protein